MKFHGVNTKRRTELSQAVTPEDKIIYTKNWGMFKVRKNGRVILKIEDDYVRCTPMGNLRIN